MQLKYLSEKNKNKVSVSVSIIDTLTLVQIQGIRDCWLELTGCTVLPYLGRVLAVYKRMMSQTLYNYMKHAMFDLENILILSVTC